MRAVCALRQQAPVRGADQGRRALCPHGRRPQEAGPTCAMAGRHCGRAHSPQCSLADDLSARCLQI